jgi:hypothetical protein
VGGCGCIKIIMAGCVIEVCIMTGSRVLLHRDSERMSRGHKRWVTGPGLMKVLLHSIACLH